MPIEFARISAQALDGLPKNKTVFFFPVGPLEDHGPHLPMSLDLYEADHLCRLAATRLEQEMPGWIGVIMPATPLGVTGNTTAAAFTVRGHVLRDWLVDICRGLIRNGFFHFVCFSGNLSPRQLTAIEEAGKLVTFHGPITAAVRWVKARQGGNRPTLVSASSALVKPSETSRAPLWPDPVEHGGVRDTSVALALGAVLGQHYATLPAHPQNLDWTGRLFARIGRKTRGYWGSKSPAEATPARGETLLRGNLDEVFPKLRAVWEGSSPNALFRSWYSILPPNQSFFAAWLIAAALISLMVAWIYVTLPGLIG